MKLSLKIEYSEQEYLAAVNNSTSVMAQLMGLMIRRKNEDEPVTVEAPPRKTEQEVEAASVNEPEPLPEAAAKQQKLLRKGEKAFVNFIHEWLKGIDMDTLLPREGVEQPDRDQLLRNTANGPTSWAILQFIASCGGLQRAIAKVTSDERLAVELARYIVPPASISFYDLADTYEHINPFKKDDEE